MFSRRVPLVSLIEFCRTLHFQLDAGLSLQQVMKQQSKSGARSVRGVAGKIDGSLRQGHSMSDALDDVKDAFPPLFLALASLGEATGHLAEIFRELETYYQRELQLRRAFRSQTIMPIIQFFLAVFIFAGLIAFLGIIASLNNSPPILTIPILGLGGVSGAIAFLGLVFGSIAIARIGFALLTRYGRQKAWFDRALLAIPALGSCMRALVMSRFALALQLTLDTGLSIAEALRLSLNATGNAYFAGKADQVELALKSGEDLHTALADTNLFGSDFLGMVASSEASGKVPEMMKHLAQEFNEVATRRMSILTTFASIGVWMIYAAFAIWCIFSIFNVYLGFLRMR